ncbi:transposase [Nitratidesulfovibrio liaohensis]|uniref:transposase n=1 Tax=Nitratidesulfovibrio liaohensis TaxID=2604158 RepID=UPI0038CD67CC
MTGHEPLSLIHDEDAARAYFRDLRWPNGAVHCLRCRHQEVYSLSRMRYRCRKCAYEFHDFTGCRLNTLRIPMAKWAAILHCFDLGMSAAKISEHSGVCYPTTLKALLIIRRAIAASTPHPAKQSTSFDKKCTWPTLKSKCNIMIGLKLNKGISWIKEIIAFQQSIIDTHCHSIQHIGWAGIICNINQYDILIYNLSDSDTKYRHDVNFYGSSTLAVEFTPPRVG